MIQDEPAYSYDNRSWQPRDQELVFAQGRASHHPSPSALFRIWIYFSLRQAFSELYKILFIRSVG
jgi:hypothetical protein